MRMDMALLDPDPKVKRIKFAGTLSANQIQILKIHVNI
jgi:hypothetical protein